MKTWQFALAGLAIGSAAYWCGPKTGYGQERPGWDGQVPGELRAFPSGGDPVGAFSPPATGPATAPLPSYAGGTASSANQPAAPAAPDPTREYLVTPAQGPWMVCAGYYTGADAPANAVKLALELRTNYKLPAYIFNHGAEERQKEMARVMEIIRKQRDYLKQMNVTPDPSTKIRVPHMHIEEQCAVLVGGYKDMESARRALDAIKKLPPPDPQRVKVQHEMFIVTPDGGGQRVPVNPLTHGFVVRNPSIPPERPSNQEDMDLAFLQKLNAGEPFSLLQCQKKYSLAIAQLQTPTVVQSRATSSSFLENLGFGSRAGAHEDAAAKNAHNFAELLRKMNQEAYVLHTRFNSIVTVGSYDSAEDPRLRYDADRVSNLLHLQQVVRLLPQPMPMAVPR